MSSGKHAYLIMAHKDFPQLQQLLLLLDDPRNDIYLHVDKRASAFDPKRIKTEHAGLHFVDRMVINWGGHSQIECELRMLKASLPGGYRYYHLISGMDLPLKTQDAIHAFFREHDGKNFIEFDAVANRTKNFVYRTCYYHPFQDVIGRNPGLRIRLLKAVERRLVRLQRKLKIRRREIVPLYKGTNWFSITDDMARHILQMEGTIRKQFYYSLCGDEEFLHSIAMASPYRDTIVDDSLRAIDWQRGDPYTYRLEDVPQLLDSASLFGRKFDIEVDERAIDAVAAHLTKA